MKPQHMKTRSSYLKFNFARIMKNHEESMEPMEPKNHSRISG